MAWSCPYNKNDARKIIEISINSLSSTLMIKLICTLKHDLPLCNSIEHVATAFG